MALPTSKLCLCPLFFFPVGMDPHSPKLWGMLWSFLKSRSSSSPVLKDFLPGPRTVTLNSNFPVCCWQPEPLMLPPLECHKQYLWMVWVAWTFLPHHQGDLNLVDWQHLWNAWFKPSHIHPVPLCEHGSPSFPVSSTRFLPLRENLDHAHSCLIVCSFQCPHVAYSRTRCQIALTWMSYHVCGLSSNHATEVYHQELRKAFHFGQPVRDLYGHLKLFCDTPSGKQLCWQLPQSPRGRNK